MGSGNLTFHQKSLLLLLAFYLIAYIFPLGFRQMVRPDEFRYAEVPREMIASGDWVVPQLNGMHYFEKPALGYQLTALSFKIFGENAFALRLPAALGAGLAALALYLLLRKHSREKYLAPLGTAVFLAAGLVYGVGTFAVMDSQLNAMLTVMMVAFYFAWRAGKAWSKVIPLLILAGVAAGGAFLIKGFLAFAVPVGVIVPFLIWEKQFKRVFIYPWLPFAACLLVVLPWSLAIYHQEPEFWKYFIVEEHWNRFTSSTYDRDPQPFWYFIPFLIGGMMPAGLLWCIAWLGWNRNDGFALAPDAKWRHRVWKRIVSLRLFQDPLLRYLCCWTVIPFLLFSASSCKLGTYILPVFAPLAALTAYGVIVALRDCEAKASRILSLTLRIFGTAVAVIGGLGMAFLIVIRLLGKLPVLYSGVLFMQLLTLAFILLWGVAIAMSVVRQRNNAQKLTIFLLGMAPAIFFGMKSIPDGLLKGKAIAPGIQYCLEQIPLEEGDIILADRNTMTSVNWLLKRNDVIVLGRPGELLYALTNHPEYASRWYEDNTALELLKNSPKGKRVYIGMRNFKKYPIPVEWQPFSEVTAQDIKVVRF